MAHAPGPINKHLLSHDSDKWKPPLHPYEIVYPQKLLTWRYEKLGCPGIYHIPRVQCRLARVKWLRHPLHICPTILSLKVVPHFCSCLQQEVTHTHTGMHTRTHAHCLVNQFLRPSVTHLFRGWWCIHCWQEARSPLWCTSAGRTCTCSRAPGHAGSTWWCRDYWCLQSAAAPLQCRWLDVKTAAKWCLAKLRV